MDLFLESRFGIWLAIGIVVTLDSIMFVKEGVVSARIVRGNIKIRTIDYPFLLRGREPIVTVLTFPMSYFLLILPVVMGDRRTDPREYLDKELARRNATKPLSMLAVIATTLIVVGGPSLTIAYGLQTALLVVWPLTYGLAGLGCAYVWRFRKQLGVAKKDAGMITFECVVCPFLVANVVKKIVMCGEVANCTIDELCNEARLHGLRCVR